MTREEALKRLSEYEGELRAILGRFVHKPDSISIAKGDQGRLEPLVIELRDLFTDFLGPNSYSAMVVNAYNEGVANFYSSPSYNGVERLIGIVSAASVRIKNNPDLAKQTLAEVAAEPKPKELEVPDKVTVRWLINHVPVSLWLMIAGMLAASFMLGVGSAKLSIVQEWFNITPSQAQTGGK